MKGEPELYKPAEACRVAEVAPYVLRYWETEFPALSEGKSKGPARLYTAREVKIISRIRQLLYDEGFTVAGAKKRLEAEIAEGRFDGSAPAPSAPPKKPVPDAPPPRPATASASAAAAPIREAPAASGFPERKKVLAELKEIAKLLDRSRQRR
jgi:DNA-binding transcriptional MerR regulator